MGTLPRGLAVVGLAATAPLTGCAGLEEDDVGRVAGAFEDPAAAPAERCALLAPSTLQTLEAEESAPCADVIGQVPLPGGAVEAVEVWGGDAQVRLSGDTVFLGFLVVILLGIAYVTALGLMGR